jgi:serine/threonine-protein kinase HipA
MATANVYQGSQLVGHLDRLSAGIRLSFVDGVSLRNGWLATTLPHETAEFPDLPPFFLNLLPEGARLRLLLESSRSRDDSLDLLMRVGWDTIGDVAVLPEGRTPQDRAARVNTKDLDQVSFWTLFHEGISEFPDSAVPGVQEKISASTIAFGVKAPGVPSAILKLNPPKFPRLIHNEEFFLRMAKACRLQVNRAEVVHDVDGEPGLLVTRFDRTKRGAEKLHQEDGCQLLNSPPANKYHPPLRAIADRVANLCTSGVVEVERFMRLVAFSYLIGNGDLHAKNISVLWSDVVRLSPGYDLLSTLPYKFLDRHMALKFQGKDDNLRMGDFLDFGRIYGLTEKATRDMLDTLCRNAEPWIARVGEIGFDSATTEDIQREIAKRISHLRR